MYCAQNNRIYCSDCNKSYIPNNYSNHLKSKGHYINVMKKSCNNHDLTCSMNKLSLESNDSVKTDFSNVKNITKSNQTKVKHNGSEILLLRLCNQEDRESIIEDKAVLEKLYSVMGITLGEYVFCQGGYAYIRIKI